ncbi:MAG TPA: DUF4331 domain-containing protein [Candidatus Binatia bacterium]
MENFKKHPICKGLAVFVAMLMTLLTTAPVAHTASHREAPLIALDPTADLTDVYAFRSWENSDKAVFIMNVIPQQAPASGPNFFNLDDEVLYAFHFDLDQDGKSDDLTIEFTFDTEIRDNSRSGGLNFKDIPISYAGVPPITALSGPGSEGIGLRQKYQVRAVSRSKSGQAVAKAIRTKSHDVYQRPLVAVPSNVGPATIPDYPALAAQGVFDLGNGVRVFVGQREETFYIDLGSTFDSLNFRATPPILNLAQDQNDTQNPFGIDDGFEGLNITSIAIEIPKSLFSKPAVGMYASTSRQKNRKFVSDRRKDDDKWSRDYVQVARLANPLVNEVIIGTGSKDLWNSKDPEDEKQFIDFYQNPRLAFLLNAVFGTSFPTTGRSDLVTLLLTYFPPVFSGSPGILSELLRVNLDIPPTQPADQKRLTVLSSAADATFGCVSAFNPNSIPDAAGWPNGRRPNDDVTDIAIRAVAGVLLNPVPCLGDGVNFNRVRMGTPDVVAGNNISTVFPFLPTPNPGRSPAAPLQQGPNEPLFR